MPAAHLQEEKWRCGRRKGHVPAANTTARGTELRITSSRASQAEQPRTCTALQAVVMLICEAMWEHYGCGFELLMLLRLQLINERTSLGGRLCLST